ncbi:MAG TPA: alpha/beta hydrolase [Usitatibacter sp.]|jgi:pimeloyl-ACP methyl ester carboxylesterase|nr:alpha/beta hydrolase [Usitatibacter sp.]
MILLHGSNSWARELIPFADSLRPYTDSMAPNLPGHGGRPVPERFSTADFARDVIEYMDKQGVKRDFIAGYSTGGYLALYLARHYPERIEGAIAIATKYVFDEEAVKHFTFLVGFERLKPPHPRLPQFELYHHPQDWRVISTRNRDMFIAWGREPEVTLEDLARITVPVLAISGDRDPLVPPEETKALANRIPRCDVMIVQGLSHPIGSMPVDTVTQAIAVWMAKVRKDAAGA